MLLESCKAKSIPVLIVRPCAVYGTGDTHNSYGPNRFLKTAKETGEIAISGAGEEIRDHLYIDDLVSLIVLCIEHKATGIANLASGKARSFAEVVTVIQNTLDKEIKINSSPRQNPVTHKHFDITAILQQFPTFQTRSLEDGMRHIIAATSEG
jgi:nucleoside-diphosphate-sugar epimerase